MTEFLLALSAFLAAHVLPARTGLRSRLAARFGERTYLLVYSLLSLALLIWLIGAALRAPLVPLWQTELWHYHFALAVMLPACMLLVGGAATANPLSVSFRSAGYDPSRPGIVGVTRHPLLWGFALWALAHLLANGDLVSLILFGGFGLFSLAGMMIVDRRKRRQMGAEWDRLAEPTSALPFGAWFSHPAARRWRPAGFAVAVGGGGALYLLLLWLHPRVIGPDPAALLL
ncbi:NnrU family protein [Sphingosinicella rhizophila]|uniref:NnrU family protein n=1 Tax=Sphingosinicella rhizophila TaxID=3050082 RepID=A0ABU3Q924_9SPHN|nr:NnrU family protein [Sphingosinicella sp. GR2756]MDT9599906.1 NnrU family protein [Sphingosinicella sp. GR2756]